MKRLKDTTHAAYRLLCETVGLNYANLMRWNRRIGRGEPAVNKPGPRKVQPFDLAQMTAEILKLKHREKRTLGSGDLCRKYRLSISRREFGKLVRSIRKEIKRDRRALQRRVEWRAPGFIWSVDDAELGRDGRGEKVMLDNVRDLSSRHTMEPIVGPMASGEEVAGHLESLFIQHVPPLFLKRDNGSNLNHHEVDRVLGKYFVIPLNSPPHYPPYNGGIEHAQGEMKQGLIGVEKKEADDRSAYGALRAHELNHMKRRSLHGATACAVFSAGKEKLKDYSNARRKEIFEEISRMAAAAVEALRQTNRWRSEKKLADAAWRRSVETWLQNNRMINVTQPRKVLPHSHDFLVS
jgi:hypothetical protein